MDRPNLQGRVPDTITTRLPGGESAGSGDATGGPSDDTGLDANESDSRRLTTLLTLSGLGLAALGVVLRYALDSRGDGETDDRDDRDRPDFDRNDEGSVEIVGDAGALDVADEAPSDATARERGPTADEADDAPEAATETDSETDVSVETFEADRTADVDDGASADIDDGDAETEREGPPRIAPLVGMVALVGMRLFVERVRNRNAESPTDAA